MVGVVFPVPFFRKEFIADHADHPAIKKFSFTDSILCRWLHFCFSFSLRHIGALIFPRLTIETLLPRITVQLAALASRRTNRWNFAQWNKLRKKNTQLGYSIFALDAVFYWLEILFVDFIVQVEGIVRSISGLLYYPQRIF